VNLIFSSESIISLLNGLYPSFLLIIRYIIKTNGRHKHKELNNNIGTPRYEYPIIIKAIATLR
jgi:hypothetical protein